MTYFPDDKFDDDRALLNVIFDVCCICGGKTG